MYVYSLVREGSQRSTLGVLNQTYLSFLRQGLLLYQEFLNSAKLAVRQVPGFVLPPSTEIIGELCHVRFLHTETRDLNCGPWTISDIK